MELGPSCLVRRSRQDKAPFSKHPVNSSITTLSKRVKTIPNGSVYMYIFIYIYNICQGPLQTPPKGPTLLPCSFGKSTKHNVREGSQLPATRRDVLPPKRITFSLLARPIHAEVKGESGPSTPRSRASGTNANSTKQAAPYIISLIVL